MRCICSPPVPLSCTDHTASILTAATGLPSGMIESLTKLAERIRPFQTGNFRPSSPPALVDGLTDQLLVVFSDAVAAVAAADMADARNNTAPRVADALRRCLKVTNKRPKDAGRHAAGQTLLQTSQTTTPQVPPDQVCHRERQTLTIGMDIDSHSEEVDAAAAYLIPMGLPDATARIHAYCLRRR